MNKKCLLPSFVSQTLRIISKRKDTFADGKTHAIHFLEPIYMCVYIYAVQAKKKKKSYK